MRFDLRQSARYLTACLLVTIFTIPPSLMAQASSHIVSPSDHQKAALSATQVRQQNLAGVRQFLSSDRATKARSEEHTSELQSRFDLVCRLLLEKKKKK